MLFLDSSTRHEIIIQNVLSRRGGSLNHGQVLIELMMAVMVVEFGFAHAQSVFGVWLVLGMVLVGNKGAIQV